METLPLFDDLPKIDKKDALRGKSKTANNYISSIWSFPGSGGEQLYRWYGTLPRPLVEQLLFLYAQEKVLDPFMGLGTTLDVAADVGLNAVGIDSNGLACLTAEAKLFGISTSEQVAKTVEDISRQLDFRPVDDLPIEQKEITALLEGDKYKYMQKWFRKDTLKAMITLLLKISNVENENDQRLLFVAASQVVRDVASVDPRCTHHLVTKVKSFINPVPLWNDRVLKGLEIVRNRPAHPEQVRVKQGSILKIEHGSYEPDFILVHPPYLGVIHYHLIHRLATDLLDIVKIVKRPKSLEKYCFDYDILKSEDVSTDRSDVYSAFVEKLAKVVNNIISPGGRCAVIIGDQRNKGIIRHPFTDFINQFEKLGFSLEENFIWVLQNNGGMHILRRGHFIDHNYILVFNKSK